MGIGRAVVGGDRSGTAVVCAVVVRVSFVEHRRIAF